MSALSPRELAWIHRPFAALTRLSWPIAVSMLSYSAMTVVDTMMVGRLGAAALAGVGMGGVVSFALVVFSIGLLRGVKVLVSQAVGAGRRDQLADCLAAGLLVALGLGLVTAALGQLVALALPGMAASPGVGGAAATYLGIRVLGAPVMLSFAAMRETLYSADREKLTRLAVPAISTGVYGYPPAEAIPILVQAAAQTRPRLHYLEEIRFVVLDAKLRELFAHAIKEVTQLLPRAICSDCAKPGM